ncbi:3-phosphoglycerate dehydrogenase [Actinomadura darangshiensis]|uniref:3-phosphoglycerate dehydrogenase n=1 Tax=Actinomadura darangshiensis TaxID=705336 RepID=A0A4R5B798_9ACTN|nr:NAD(P)-dependent oxidoreductase [Actinomadura darangshiensis]TDD80316.1 3-phosphoglycerate dehydrogenase [Actinomadura darangshiensis]
MTAPWRILSLPPIGEEIMRGLFAPLGETAEVVFPQARDRSCLLAELPGADIVIGDFTGRLALDAEAVAAARRVSFVQMPAVGTDSIDVAALTARNVPLANAAGFNARGVAEWTVGAAFALCRNLAWGDRAVRAGEWPQMEMAGRFPREIHTQRVGIVGFGAIGSEAARLFAALGCAVSYWTRRRRPGAAATYRELDDLVSTSDILVLALPLTDETRGLIGPERLALLPDKALLVNVARGGIAPDDAVLAALDSGRLASAALDVYDEEPLPAGHPLRAREDVLLSPHTAGASAQSQVNLISMVRDNVTAAVLGRDVQNVVNGVNPQVKRRR